MTMAKRALFGWTAAILVVAAIPARAAPAESVDAVQVRAVLASYKAAVEKLDMRGTEPLFLADSRIFESGGNEGSYSHYLKHHLGPEFAEFRTFKFSDYHIDVRLEGPIAIASETYRYRIEPKQGDPVERLGVQTSVLKRTSSGWQIVNLHSSSRKPAP